MTKGGNHYRDLKIEVQDFSQKHSLNGTEHSFLKYVSRCYKKNKEKDLEKAWWFTFGETKNGTRPQDAVRNRHYWFTFGEYENCTNPQDIIREREHIFIKDLLVYCYANEFKEWQIRALVSYFNREFDDVKTFLEKGIEDLQRYNKSNE